MQPTYYFLISAKILQFFYARQLYRQILLRARINSGNSVCLSVCLSVTTRYGFKASWDRDSGFSPYDSLESLVSDEVIWCHCVRRFPSNEGIKEGYSRPLRNRYFTTIGSSSVKTVADRQTCCVSQQALPTSFSVVPTSMTFNDLEPPK